MVVGYIRGPPRSLSWQKEAGPFFSVRLGWSRSYSTPVRVLRTQLFQHTDSTAREALTLCHWLGFLSKSCRPCVCVCVIEIVQKFLFIYIFMWIVPSSWYKCTITALWRPFKLCNTVMEVQFSCRMSAKPCEALSSIPSTTQNSLKFSSIKHV
jgi:hypothetical protein